MHGIKADRRMPQVADPLEQPNAKRVHWMSHHLRDMQFREEKSINCLPYDIKPKAGPK